MVRRDISLTLALCASLIVHALVADTLAEQYVRRAGHIWLPGFATERASASSDDRLTLGDTAAVGDAYDSAASEVPLIAPHADHTQAFLSLDPPGEKSPRSSASVLASPPPTVAPPARAEATATPFGLPGQTGPLQPGLSRSSVAAAAQPPLPAAAPVGSPAEQAKTESDPVATVVDARFRPGQTDIQSGRRHKITRPHLSLAAQADLLSIANPLLTLKITTDAVGNVENVTVYQSSGSGNIDEGCKLAAYNWWFEPAKDPGGTARGDVILFKIRFI